MPLRPVPVLPETRLRPDSGISGAGIRSGGSADEVRLDDGRDEEDEELNQICVFINERKLC